MVQTILNIPKISNPSPTIIRDIFPFHNWFFSIQSLPFPLIETLSPVIVPSIRLTTKAKADKPRRNLQLASAALTTLIKSHPIYYLTNFKTWITTPASGLADFTKNGVLARQEALITLGAVVKAIWTPWAENEDGVLRARREKIGSDISAAFLVSFFFSCFF